jgi:hypothetical protein
MHRQLKDTTPTAESRAWWVGAVGLLVCLFAIMWLPALVLTLRWPNNQFGNWLFFGPQFIYPFELLWVKQAHVFEGSTGFAVDVAIWSAIAVGFGVFTKRLRTSYAIFVGIFAVICFTTVFHLVFPMLGWTFLIDGP